MPVRLATSERITGNPEGARPIRRVRFTTKETFTGTPDATPPMPTKPAGPLADQLVVSRHESVIWQYNPNY